MVAAVYILLCLIWGSTWMAIKVGLVDAPPLTTAALRFLLATVILSSIAFVRGYRFPRNLKSLIQLGYPGLYIYCISYVCVYFAEQRIDSALTGTLFGCFPFFVALLSWIRYRTEKLDKFAWLGMGIGFSGVVVISYESLQFSGDLFIGTLLAVAAAFAAAYGVIIHKRHYAGNNIVVSATAQMIFGGIFLVIGALLFEDISDFHVTVESVGSIVYLAVFGTVIAFLGYYWLLARARAVTVSLIAFVTPLVAIFIGVFFSNEQFTPLLIVGTGLILSGMFLVLRKP